MILSPFALISPFSAALTTFVLSVVILVRKPSRGGPSFVGLAFSMCIWQLGKFMKNAGAWFLPINLEWLDFWDDLSFAGASFVFSTFFRLAIRISFRDKGFLKSVSWLAYALSILFTLLEWSGYVTSGHVLTKYGYFHEPRQLYWLYTGVFSTFMSLGLYILYPGHYRKVPEMWRQTQAVFFASLFGFSFGALEFYNILISPDVPFADMGPLIFGISLYWAIFRYNLLNGQGLLRTLAFRLLYLTLLSGAVYLAYTGTALLLNFLHIPPSNLVTVVLCSILLFFLTPAYIASVRAVRRRFNPVRYSFRNILLVLSSRLSRLADPAEMLRAVLEEMENHLGYERGSAVLFPTPGQAESTRIMGLPLPAGSRISASMDWPELTSRSQLLTDLRHGKILPEEKHRVLMLFRRLRRLNADVALAIRSRERTLGVFLLREKSIRMEDWNTTANLLSSLASFAGERIAHVSSLRELARQEHLGQVGMMSATLAHEIKNPLQGIYGATRMLEEEGKGNPRFLKIIRRDSESLQDVVQSFLKFSRPFEVNLQEVDLRKFLKIFTNKQKSLGELVCLKIHEKLSACLSIKTDPDALQQILLNLVQNALRHEEEGREVEIELKENLNIRVRDHGKGVPPEDRHRLFEPFFTTSTKGTGLGLAISRKLCREMGCDLIYRPENPGSSFILKAQRDKVPDLH